MLLVGCVPSLALSASQVSLAWNDNSSNETGFKIERAIGDLAFGQITTVGANVTTYVDTDVTPSTAYRYRVRATSGAGDSAYSNIIYVTSPGNTGTAPSITNIPDLEMSTNSSSAPIAFTVSDADTAASSLLVSGSSSNTALIPNAALVFSGSESNRSLTITPVAGQSGTATITVTVSDGVMTASDSFIVTVNAPTTGQSQTMTFANATPIVIPDNASDANPYPSQISVAGMEGTITVITVKLIGFSQSWTNDMDVLLVSPGGQKLLLMSDVATGVTTNATFTFSDNATASLPESGALYSGSYKPTNYDTTTDAFAAPAPAGPFATSLSVFNGANPTGKWSLYVRDAGPGEGRRFDGGWELTLSTSGAPSQPAAAPTISDIADVTLAAGTAPSPLPFTITDADTPATGLSLSASSSNQTLVPTSAITFGGSGNSRTVSVTPASGQSGVATITVSVSDGTRTASDAFTVTVTAPPVAKPQTLSFSNTTPIVIPDQASDANPYPSQIHVAGLNGLITEVSVKLTGFSQVWTNDMDVLLVSPTGQKLLLMSDVGTGVTSNATFTFKDSATTSLPESGSLLSGTYRPTNYDTTTDTFTFPAPSGPLASALSVFNERNPNGTWTLYMRDAGPGEGRRFDGGWSLTISTSGTVTESAVAPIISEIADLEIPANTTAPVIAFSISDGDTPAEQLIVSATSSNQSLIPASAITLGGSGSARTISVTPATGQSGTATVTVTVSDGMQSASESFAVTVVNTIVAASKPAFETQPPATQTVTAGNKAVLSAGATGAPSPTYQWRRNGTNIAGATNASLVFDAVSSADSATYSVIAANSAGTATSNNAVLIVYAKPEFKLQPVSQTVVSGANAKFSVEVSAIPGATLQWHKNGTPIPGATAAVLTLNAVSSGNVGSYAVLAKNDIGSTWSQTAELVLGKPPVITKQPVSQKVAAKTNVTFTAAAEGVPAPSYQWKKNGVNIAGATLASLTLKSVSQSDAAEYRVEARNSLGYTLSNRAQLSVNNSPSRGTKDDESDPTDITPVAQSGLVNLSVRAMAGSGTDGLIVGFVINGAASKPILVRGIGPTLREFGVAGALSDPALALYSGSSITASNDDWSVHDEPSDVAQMAAHVGAFNLPEKTLDAALTTALEAGAYTVQLSGKDTSTGVALLEVYDGANNEMGQLVNLSVRTSIGGAEAPNVGFVIAGSSPRKILIRVVGPTLSAFGVDESVQDPRLELFQGNSKIDENDNWGGGEGLTLDFQRAGAFALSGTNSLDAALVTWLEPGAYTVVASGMNNSQGVALIEVYDIPSEF